MDPVSICSNPFKQRISADFPAPLRPVISRISSAWIFRDKLSTAQKAAVLLKQRLTFFKEIKAGFFIHNYQDAWAFMPKTSLIFARTGSLL